MTDIASGWTDMPFDPGLGIPVLRQAIDRHPGNARLRALLGDELRNAGDYGEALERFHEALAIDPRFAPAWIGTAACLRKLGRPAEVLALCDGDWAGDEASMHHERGRALIRMGRIAEGEDALHQAIRLEYPRVLALRALLESFARTGDGAAILALCDTLDARQQALALVRAYRALALSLLDQPEAARALVDLDRCARRYRFEPPAELGGAGEVNARLAEAILARASGQATDINYRPRLSADADVRALRSFIRESVADYIRQTEAVRAAADMAAVPDAASLSFGTVVLHGKGRNGQHIHPIGYLSTVYHVRVPPRSAGGGEHDGALVLGSCYEVAGGHRGCWGERYLPAAEGWLTIFPSHIFHDVVPTGSNEPRIAIVSDLNPQRAGAGHIEMDD